MTTLFAKLPRKTLITTGLVIALAGSVGAASARGAMNQERMAERFDYIFTQLSLTESQRSSVLEVMTDLREQRRELSMTDWQTLMADELGMVLQATQVEGLMTYLEAHSPNRQGGRHGRRHGGSRGDHRATETAPAIDEQ